MEEMTKKAVAMLQVAYPNFTDKQMVLYGTLLANYPGAVVSKAIGEILKTSESNFAPPVGKICNLCEKIIAQAKGETPHTPADAWGEVRYVVTRIGPYAVKDYSWQDKIAEQVAKAIGLEVLFSMTEGTEEDVIRSNFLKMYEGKTRQKQEEKHIAKTLSDGRVKAAIAAVSEKMILNAGESLRKNEV